jgi:hypothetical protein
MPILVNCFAGGRDLSTTLFLIAYLILPSEILLTYLLYMPT